MLPRQRRAGVATYGARRERMRPWQRPEPGRRPHRPAHRPRASAPTATELWIQRVEFPCVHHFDGPDRATAHTPHGWLTRRPRIRRPHLARPSIFGQSQCGLEPDDRKNVASFMHIRHALLRPASDRTASCRRLPRSTGTVRRSDTNSRPNPHPKFRTYPLPELPRDPLTNPSRRRLSPGRAPAASPRFRPDAQSGRRSSPPGPVHRLRGMRRRFPPARSVQCDGPTHAAPMQTLPYGGGQSARPGAQPHARSTPGHLRRGPRKGRPHLANRGRSQPPEHESGLVSRPRPTHHAATLPPRTIPAPPRAPPPAAPPRSPPPNLFRNPFPPPPRPLLRTPSRVSGGSRLPSPFPRPSPFLRLPPTTTAPAAPRAFRLPTDRRRSPPEDSEPTTIPPYGRLPLNGRDAANYAGFTDVLSRAAYSSGLGQMRVRPECRGSSLGRTRYECRAPQR